MYSVQRELCIVPAGHYKFRYNKQLQRVKQIILIMTGAMNAGQSPVSPCTQWHNGDLLLVRGPLAWSGQWWEEGSVASIGGTNGQLGHRGGRITEHCHRSTRVQTLHPSLHQEPSRILIASGLPYMKLPACLLDLPPRVHSTTHDL